MLMGQRRSNNMVRVCGINPGITMGMCTCKIRVGVQKQHVIVVVEIAFGFQKSFKTISNEN